MLCQFSDDSNPGKPRPKLADFISVPGVYPAGRLDRDSEGLLLLTDDGRLQNQIADPRHQSEKRYLVQVEGVPGARQLQQLRAGVRLKDGMAHARDVQVVPRKPGWLWRRDPPIRTRKNIPVSWLELTLTEGRNRQVRRMTAAVGLPTLRLVRRSIGHWSLDGLEPGQWREEQA